MTETVTIAKRTFTVERTEDSDRIFLHGPRGAVYFLRGFTGEDTGVRVLVSWKSGSELRDRCGQMVRVFVAGDVIAEIAPRRVSR